MLSWTRVTRQAATTGSLVTTVRPIVSRLALPAVVAAIPATDGGRIPGDTSFTDGRLVWSMRAQAGGIRHLDLAVDGRRLLAKGASLRLFSLTHNGRRVHFSDLQQVRIDPDEPGLRVTGMVPDDLPAARVTLTWEAIKAGRTRVSLDLENLHTQPVHWQVAVPVANGLELGRAGQEQYFYPARSGVLSDAPLHALNPYGGRMWWQVTAVYD
jgi:hypothetical protein